MGGSAADEDFLSSLIAQACLMLLESQAFVRCRAADKAAVKSAIPAAVKKYTETVLKQSGKHKTVAITIDDGVPLAAETLGGVIVHCGDGSITVDNTIAARLKLV